MAQLINGTHLTRETDFAHSGEVGDDGVHDLLVAAVLVRGDLELEATVTIGISGIVLVENLGRGVDVVLGVLPRALLVTGDSGRDDVVGRGARTMEEGIADGLAVDGHGHGVTQVHVSEGALDHVAGEVVGGGLRAVQELVARGDGVAILGLAVLLGSGRKRSDGHVGDIL